MDDPWKQHPLTAKSVSGVFTAEQCETIKNYALAVGMSRATVLRKKKAGGRKSQHRTSDQAELPRTPETEWIFEHVAAMSEAATPSTGGLLSRGSRQRGSCATNRCSISGGTSTLFRARPVNSPASSICRHPDPIGEAASRLRASMRVGTLRPSKAPGRGFQHICGIAPRPRGGAKDGSWSAG